MNSFNNKLACVSDVPDPVAIEIEHPDVTPPPPKHGQTRLSTGHNENLSTITVAAPEFEVCNPQNMHQAILSPALVTTLQ
jgi:hypothetical protein